MDKRINQSKMNIHSISFSYVDKMALSLESKLNGNQPNCIMYVMAFQIISMKAGLHEKEAILHNKYNVICPSGSPSGLN